MCSAVAKLILLFFVASATTLPIFADDTKTSLGVSVSNDDPKWGETITVRYVPPDSSVFATKSSSDTLFCAAFLYKSTGDKISLVPMKRIKDNLYTCPLYVPDSTNSIRIIICIPDYPVSDGILKFKCKNRMGQRPPNTIFSTTYNLDSAFAVERSLYPWNYLAYPTVLKARIYDAEQRKNPLSDSTRRLLVNSTIDEVRKANAKTPIWFFALAELESMRKGGDSIASELYTEAAKLNSYDPFYNDTEFWATLLKRRMINNQYIPPYNICRAITALVEKFPKTEMAKIWLTRSAGDTLINAKVYRSVSTFWKNTYDFDLLIEMSFAYSNEKSPLHDNAVALEYINRAEVSSRKKIGFYLAQNIYGSTGRLGRMMAYKGSLLVKLGKAKEAIPILSKTLVEVKEPREKELLGKELSMAYAAERNYSAAERSLGIAMGYGSHLDTSGIESIYTERKHKDETKDVYLRRIAEEYRSQVDLPPIPDFAYQTLDGTKGTIAGHRGKIVVLDYWFIGCAGCVIERKSMSDLVESYQGDSTIVFLSVALDDAKSIRSYQEKSPSKYPVVPSGDAITRRCGVTGAPTHIILDKNGNTALWEMGGSTTSGESLRKRIEEIKAKRN